MKNSLKLLTLSLFILLVQNVLAANNKAGDSTKPIEDLYSSAIGIANKASKEESSAFGYKNTASGAYNLAFGNANTANGQYSSTFERSGIYSLAFGDLVFVSGKDSGAFGKGECKYNNKISDYKYKIEGHYSWAIGSKNSIAAGCDNNHILGNNIAIGPGISSSIVLGDKFTVEESNTKAMANVGLTWKFGKGGSQQTMNTNNMYSIQEEVKRFTAENKKYMAKVTEQQSEIETLKAAQKKM